MVAYFSLSRRYTVPVIGILVSILVLGIFVFKVQTSAASQIRTGIARCEKEGTRMQQCFEQLITDMAHAHGIGAGFDALAALYDRDDEFATYCHGNTHELGQIAYREFEARREVDFTIKMSYCGFGFFHGFIEALMAEKSDLSEAARFCTLVDSKLGSESAGVPFACYHGIGHGVVDGSDPSRWHSAAAYIEPGLALCKILSPVEEWRTRCASGVFNALAIAYRDERYSLGGNPDDPYAICRRQGESYERKACYDQMNGYVVLESKSFKEALKKASKVEKPFDELAVSTVAGFRSLRAMSDRSLATGYLQDCASLPVYASVCATGFAGGLIEFGNPGKEYQDAAHICASVPETREACFKGLVYAAKYRLKPEEHVSVCQLVGELGNQHEMDACSSTMSGSTWKGE